MAAKASARVTGEIVLQRASGIDFRRNSYPAIFICARMARRVRVTKMEKPNSMYRYSVTVGGRAIDRLPIPDTLREFSTPDLYQCSFLVARGRRVLKVRHDDRYRFFFEQTTELDTDLSDFHSNAQVGVRDFVSAMYSVKRMMREQDAQRR